MLDRLNNGSENFPTIGHDLKSETNILNLYTSDNDLFLVDSPGYNDTSGAEIDISNGVLVFEALK